MFTQRLEPNLNQQIKQCARAVMSRPANYGWIYPEMEFCCAPNKEQCHIYIIIFTNYQHPEAFHQFQLISVMLTWTRSMIDVWRLKFGIVQYCTIQTIQSNRKKNKKTMHPAPYAKAACQCFAHGVMIFFFFFKASAATVWAQIIWSNCSSCCLEKPHKIQQLIIRAVRAEKCC